MTNPLRPLEEGSVLLVLDVLTHNEVRRFNAAVRRAAEQAEASQDGRVRGGAPHSGRLFSRTCSDVRP